MRYKSTIIACNVYTYIYTFKELIKTVGKLIEDVILKRVRLVYNCSHFFLLCFFFRVGQRRVSSVDSAALEQGKTF